MKHHHQFSHPHPCAAHCPHSATAPGAAQACPTCLPTGSNQLTIMGDFRLGRPVENSFHFAVRTSQLGSFRSGTPRFLQNLSRVFHTPDHGTPELRTCETTTPICHFAACVSGFPAHANRFGQIGPPAMTTAARVVRLNGLLASRPFQINSFTCRPADSSRLLVFSSLMSVPCSGGQGLRPLAPPLLTGAAHQLTFSAASSVCRPIERAVRSASVPSQLGDFRSMQPPFPLAPVRNIASDTLICGHCSGRRALRFLGPLAIADAASQRSFPEPSGSIRPFSPSSPAPNSQLRTQRKGGFSNVLPKSFQNSAPILLVLFKSSEVHETLGFSDVSSISPLPNVIEQSDFPWKSRLRFFAAQKISIRRVSGTLRGQPISHDP